MPVAVRPRAGRTGRTRSRPAAAARVRGYEQEVGHAKAAEHAALLAQRELVKSYCVTCHNERRKTGGLSLDAIADQPVAGHADSWERVIRKRSPSTGSQVPPTFQVVTAPLVL